MISNPLRPFLFLGVSLFMLAHASFLSAQSPCRQAMIAYARQYPAAEPRDLYKLCFQDAFGPGHLTIDSVRSSQYISEEAALIRSDSNVLYEYTLCDSNYVRVNLVLVRDGVIPIPLFVNALIRSVDASFSPDSRYVVHHMRQFNEAYNFHYRIIRRDIFEAELLPLIDTDRRQPDTPNR